MLRVIPRTIHYCWFGKKEKPKSVLKCISSWKRVCSDYEIIEWNESNFDVSITPYTQYCYDNKKWAFLSDFARLWIVYNYGGIYYDTDVEVKRSPSDLLEYISFFGHETDELINTGLGFGSEKGNIILKDMMEEYNEMRPDKEGNYALISCPQLNTRALLKRGFYLDGSKQLRDNTIILPTEYMNPYDYTTGILRVTENTMSIHWFSKTWISKKSVLRSKIIRPFHRIFGKDCFAYLRRFK